MKTVCILVQNYYEIDIRVRRKAEALVAAGYSVDVLALASSFSESNNYTLNGVHVFTLKLGKKRASLLRYAFEYAAFFLWCFIKLTALTGKRRYSIVDVNNLPDFLVFAAAPAKMRGAKVIFDMHEITPEFYMSKFGITDGSMAIRLMKWIEKASFRFADHVITINEPIVSLLEGRGLPKNKTTVIMNAVDEALFASASGSTGQPSERPKFVMMYHGTLTHIYGLDIALEAFAKVHWQMEGAEFWILGGGPEKRSLENLCGQLGLKNKVKFIGNVLPDEIPQWLKCCHVGVLPTRRDVFLDFSFSNKLSEYIIMGKAVICSELKAIRHYFGPEALAYFKPNDPTALAGQMLRVFRDEELRLRLAEKARQEYQPINWDVMKQRYLERMREISGQADAATSRCPSSVVNASVA